MAQTKRKREYGIEEFAIRVFDRAYGSWKNGAPVASWAYPYVMRDEPYREMQMRKELRFEAPHVVGDGSGRLLWFADEGLVRYDFAADQWDQPPGPRFRRPVMAWEGPLPSKKRNYGATARSPNGRVYLIGGLGGDVGEGRGEKLYVPQATVDAYDPKEDRWEHLAPMTAPRSDHAAAVAADGKLYVFGGCACDKRGKPSIARTEVYDPETNTWSTAAPMPQARQLVTASTAPDGRIFVVGGLVDLNKSDSSSRVDIYDPKTNTWKQGPSLKLGRHAHAQVTSSDGLIYVLGGFKAGGAGPTGPLDSVEILDTTLLTE